MVETTHATGNVEGKPPHQPLRDLRAGFFMLSKQMPQVTLWAPLFTPSVHTQGVEREKQGERGREIDIYRERENERELGRTDDHPERVHTDAIKSHKAGMAQAAHDVHLDLEFGESVICTIGLCFVDLELLHGYSDLVNESPVDNAEAAFRHLGHVLEVGLIDCWEIGHGQVRCEEVDVHGPRWDTTAVHKATNPRQHCSNEPPNTG